MKDAFDICTYIIEALFLFSSKQSFTIILKNWTNHCAYLNKKMVYYLKFVSVDFKDFSEEITYNVSFENFEGYIIC